MDVVHKIRAFGLARHIIMALCLLSFYAPSASQAKDRKLLISSFQDIVIVGDLIVNFETGRSTSAVASGERIAIESLRISKSGDQLTLTQTNAIYSGGGGRNVAPLTIIITNRSLRNITIRGNGQLMVNELRQAGNSRINLFGSGQVNIASAAIGTMDVAINGGANLSINAGKVREAKVSIDGSGQYLASALEHNILDLTQNGSAVTKANVTDRAEISNNGAGNVSITGKGKCNISRSGNGAIICSNFAKKRMRAGK